MNDKPTIGQVLQDKVEAYARALPRSQQSDAGQLGISDVGGCREYARLRSIGATPTERRTLWAANVGTAIHAMIDLAIEAAYGDDVITKMEVKATYPNGAVLPGHPDLVFPAWNVVVDLKTVDGLHTIRKSGPTNRQWMQVMAYGTALIEDGTFDPEKPVRCVLLYVDRSAREDEFLSFERTIDPLVMHEAAEWIDDVVYAVRHDEGASKDRPRDWCERFCDFFTACRGDDIPPEGGLIEDPEALTAIDLYLEGHEMERRGKAMKNEAKAHLDGVTGSTGKAIVRWTMVAPSEVPGYTRDGYTRLDIKPIKNT